MERSPQDAPPSEIMDAEETFHNVFFYFIASLKILAMEPEAQCEAQGNYNVGRNFSRKHSPEETSSRREDLTRSKRLPLKPWPLQYPSCQNRCLLLQMDISKMF
jgi:hypothetical protein